MKVEEFKTDGISILQLFDRIDASSSKELKEIVTTKIDQNKINLLFDMSQVSFIDSSGLGMLISCFKSIKKAGGQFKISNLSHNVKTIFDTTRMDRVFEIFENNEDALRSYKVKSNQVFMNGNNSYPV
jgi:anti-sigma B factor antagonist